MATRTLPKQAWKPYFDFVSRFLQGRGVDIEVVGMDIGAQKQGRIWRMFGITYDPKNDIVEVAMHELDHLIYHPTSVRVIDGGLILKVIEVTQRDGVRQIIQVIEPLQLPPPPEVELR